MIVLLEDEGFQEASKMKHTQKKAAITSSPKISSALKDICELVILLPPDSQTAESFYQLVKQHQDYELYMDEVSELGLRLGQLVKGLTYLNQQQKIIHYLDKGTLNHLNDQTYFKLLLELAKNEKTTAKPLLKLNIVWEMAR